MRRLSADERDRLEAIVTEAFEQRSGRAIALRGKVWDSHILVHIIFAAEDAFGLALSSDEMEKIVDRDSLQDVIEARLTNLPHS
jgi:acyl carrier protein